MTRIILSFTSKEDIAEFILNCKITEVQIDMNYLTVSGSFTEDCLELAFNQYGALISEKSDYTN
jgi:predicted metalloenzyme YecM